MDKIDDSRPNGKLSWFAFYPADFAGETAHLTDAELASFFRLMCYAAQTGCLPSDDVQLARIARRSAKEWLTIRSVLEPLFRHDGRLVGEFRKARERYNSRAAAGSRGGMSRARTTLGAPSPAIANAYQLQPQPHPEPEKVRGCREEAPSSKGRAHSVEGSARVQEEELTRGQVHTPMNGKGWVH